jgi:hypothetical protein
MVMYWAELVVSPKGLCNHVDGSVDCARYWCRSC